LHSISDAHGPLVREFGEELHDELNREIQDQRGKLVEKINRAITKNQDHLRLSIRDLIASGWEKMLPNRNVQAPMTNVQ
jgi:polyhydroxyalkanoate synthesis regulator phasin